MPSIILPNTIDLNTQKSAPEIQSNFDAIQAGLNGGLDETNVPNLAAAFTTYKPGPTAFGNVTGGTATAPYFMASNGGMLQSGASSGVGPQAFYFDPAAYTANARTTKLRVKMAALSNATAPAITATAGLYPVTAATGGALALAVTLGAVVAGSTIASGAIGASSVVPVVGPDFNAPAAGMYAIGVALSGAQAANSMLSFSLMLEIRQV